MNLFPGFKTIAFAVLVALISLFSDPGLQAYIGENVTWLGPILSIVIVALRAISTSPIFNIKPKE